MKHLPVPRCARCEAHQCRQEKDCFNAADRHREGYEDEALAALHRAELIIQSEEGKGTEATVLFTGRIQQSDKPETPAAYHGHDRTNTKEDHDP